MRCVLTFKHAITSSGNGFVLSGTPLRARYNNVVARTRPLRQREREIVHCILSIILLTLLLRRKVAAVWEQLERLEQGTVGKRARPVIFVKLKGETWAPERDAVPDRFGKPAVRSCIPQLPPARCC